MTATILDLAAFRARRAEKAAAREAAFADCVAKAQPQAIASSLAPLEPVGLPEPDAGPPSAVEPAAVEPDEPEPIRWRTSARGNPWTTVGEMHIVIFPNPDDPDRWCARVQHGTKRGRYLQHVWPSAEDAQEAASVWRSLAARQYGGSNSCS